MSNQPSVILKPVTNKKDGIILLDIYINGEWCGSRRTYAQCQKFLEKALKNEHT